MAGSSAVTDARRRPGANLGNVITLRPWLPLSPLLLLLLLASAVLFTGSSALQYCEADDIDGIYGHCWQSIQRRGPPVPPSRLCCMFIGDADKLPCVCQFLITQEVEQSISIPKLAAAAKKCGAPLMPGTKCGSYVAPAPASSPSPTPGDD